MSNGYVGYPQYMQQAAMYGQSGQPVIPNYQQNQQPLNPSYANPYAQQIAQGPSINNGFNGFFIDNYEQVKNTIVNTDGTPTIFIHNSEDKFWIKKIGDDGRTIIKSFGFNENIDNGKSGAAAVATAEQPSQADYINALINKLNLMNERVETLERKLLAPQQQSGAIDKGETANAKQFNHTNDF